MNLGIIIIFFILSLLGTYLFIKQSKYFIPFFFMMILVQPAFQKLSDPTIYGSTLRVMSLGRISTNLMLLLNFLFLLPLLKYRFVNVFKNYTKYFAITIILYIISATLSEDIIQSFILTIVSLLPILFFYLLISTKCNYLFNEGMIVKYCSLIVIFNFLFGLFFMFYSSQGNIVSMFVESRGGSGGWLSNYGLQCLVLIAPICFIYTNNKLIQLSTAVVIFLSAMTTMSRMIIVIVILQVFLLTYYKIIKKRYIILGSLLLIVPFLFLTEMGGEMFSFIVERFGDSDGSGLLEKAQGDPRFVIYDVSIASIQDYPLFGIGVGNFHKLTAHGYSDSHNLFLSIWQSRGFFLLIMFIVALVYFFIMNYRLTKVAKGNSKKLLLCLRIGMIGYLLASMSGSDLFIYSGLSNARPSYFLIFVFVIQEYQNLNLLRSSKLISINNEKNI